MISLNSENYFLVPKQIEQLFVKFHYKYGATIYGAVTQRCFSHTQKGLPTMGVSRHL